MSLTAPETVEDLLNYRLARLLSATSTPGIRLLEGRFGVTRRQWGLLGLMAAHGAMSPSELSRLSHLEPSKVSLSITELVSRGLVHRETLAGDRRRAVVGLTEAGERLYKTAFPLLADLSRTMLGALSADEVMALDCIMRKLGESAEEWSSRQPVAEKADRRRGGSRRTRFE
jgi:DNA-binding MarR family transcriptional regulator